MGELDPALKAALAGRRVLFFGAVELALPDRTVRLLDGAGEVPISGERFSGRDPDWGVLDTVRGLEESLADTAGTVTISTIPASTMTLAAMLDPALQGSPVRIMVGAINPASGLPIGECYVPFQGEFDIANVRWLMNDRRVDIRCNGIGERLFAIEEGRRLSSAFQGATWPGELGLAFVTGVDTDVPWGQTLKTEAVAIRSNLGVNSGFAGSGGMSWGTAWRSGQVQAL